MPDAETILTGIATSLAATALWESSKWAWKHRQEIANKLRRATPQPVTVLSGSAISTSKATGSLVLSGSAISRPRSTSRATGSLVSVGSERQALWNVEAPTSPLTTRLVDEGLEFLSWYLRQR